MTIAKPKANDRGAAGALFLERLAGPGDRVARRAALRAATSSTAAIASPELTPGAPLPSTLAREEAVEALELLGPDDVR